MMTFNESLRWRYATKKFDPAKKLSDAEMADLLESARLSASSFGLQPYKIVLVADPAVRAKVREHAWNQSQVTDASHLVAFCPMKTIDADYVKKYVDIIAATRGIPAESLTGFHDMMVGSIAARTPEQLAAWLRCQAYIAVGFLLSAAAAGGIDACPMEGFDPAHVDVDLGLLDENVTSAVLVALGHRADDDASASYAKVRFPKEELFLRR
jgi:nitroreductase/dihydropteridine reductase